MKVCGIELSGSTATFCLIDGDGDGHVVVDVEQKKLSLTASDSAESVKSFRTAFEAFLRDHDVDLIAIKKRNEKGKFAGGATTFKLEGLIQLSQVESKLLSANRIASIRKKESPEPPETLNKYQHEAFFAAFASLQEA